MANLVYHSHSTEVSAENSDMHRALLSLMEELAAVDAYNQRASACSDTDLKDILEHNRDEEKEHAAMLLEWIRRKDEQFSLQFSKFLFSDKPALPK